MKDKQRKPKTQSGFASFSMHELAELITKPIKPKQNEQHGKFYEDVHDATRHRNIS